MKKFTAIIAILVLVIAAGVVFGEANILANGSVAIPITTTPSTNTQSVGLYNIKGQEWGEVCGIRIRNNSAATTTVTTVTCTDLGTTTPIGSITTNTLGTSSFISTYTTGAAPTARMLQIQVVIPVTAVATTLDYYIYGR